MTVQELIDRLQQVEDKEKQVSIYDVSSSSWISDEIEVYEYSRTVEIV